jgi:hypothetical protein
VRMKVENAPVDDADKGMERFQSLLGKLVKVPKSEALTKRKRPKARPKQKRKRKA